MQAVSQAWYRFRHMIPADGNGPELEFTKAFTINKLPVLAGGEWMEKLAGVPPVRRQFIDENDKFRQIYGNFRSQFWV